MGAARSYLIVQAQLKLYMERRIGVERLDEVEEVVRRVNGPLQQLGGAQGTDELGDHFRRPREEPLDYGAPGTREETEL